MENRLFDSFNGSPENLTLHAFDALLMGILHGLLVDFGFWIIGVEPVVMGLPGNPSSSRRVGDGSKLRIGQ